MKVDLAGAICRARDMLWAAVLLDFKLLVGSVRIVCGRRSIAIKGTILPRSAKANIATPAVRGQLTEAQLKAIDVAVGGQVRLRRILLGMSQDTVSKSLDLTFQQLQKYEHGTNRISGSRLYQLATILHCPVAYFFETVDVDSGPAAAEDAIMGAAAADEIPSDLMKKRKTVELVRAFYAIENASQRNATLAMLKSLAKGQK